MYRRSTYTTGFNVRDQLYTSHLSRTKGEGEQSEAGDDNLKEKYAILLDTLIESIFQGVPAVEIYQSLLGSLVGHGSISEPGRTQKTI
jgi:hypothetical protein